MTNPFLNITKRFPLTPLPSAGKPIFILSTIWRSGSTALQRTLVTDPSIQVWGEPYADANLITSLSRSALALTQPNWPHHGHFPTNKVILDNPEEYFIANWYPPMQSMYESHRAMLDRLFKQSALDLGKERFGIKFVRIGLEELHYLEWLYPDAKFLILFRNPWDCWRSYKGYNWMYRWPKGRITTVQQFAKLWEKQTRDLLSHPQSNTVRAMRYEDFLHPDFNWDRLRDFCELPNLNNNALKKRISGVNIPPQPITDEDCQVIAKICGKLTESFGYRGLKDTDTEVAIGEWREPITTVI